MPRHAGPRRSVLRWLLTAAVVALVSWFVAGAAREAWAQLSASGVRPRWGLLAASGLVYLLALGPMAWYWRRVIRGIDGPVAWRPLLAAYYAGHLGKYVPGKAMVVVIRTAMLKRHGNQTGPLAASVVVETLTLMATGAALAAGLMAFGPLGGAPGGGRSPWLLAAAVGMAVVAVLPTLPPVLRWLVCRLTRSPAPRLPWRLLAIGWAAATATWCGLTASLWLAVLGCGGVAPASLATAGSLLLATTLPFVAGFLSLLPGGLVIRDALMLGLLAPVVGEGAALAAAAAARLVWIVAELAAYTGARVFCGARLTSPPDRAASPAAPPDP